MSNERIERELALLLEGGQRAELATGDRTAVIYFDVPTGGQRLGLPAMTDVLVPVPPGYPANLIDLAGLPVDSVFLPRVRGGQNNQGVVNVGGRQWQLASYHPHTNGGGPPWDETKCGFHTYIDHVIAWLDKLN